MMTDSNEGISASASTQEPAPDRRQGFAFANPTGICRDRVDTVAEVAARGWGLMLPPTAMTAVRTSSRAIVSRALATLVKTGEMQRMRIVGTNECVWGTTSLLAKQFPHSKAGTRFFRPKGGELWRPYKEFVHNQLALRVLCGLAEPSKFRTEPELEHLVPKGSYVPDGLVHLTLDDIPFILELQLEKSRKTGTKGGWEVLGRRIAAICQGEGLARWESPFGTVNGTILVAPIKDASQILSHVRKYIQDVDDAPPVWFLFSEIQSDTGAPVRDYSDIRADSRLSPVRVWYAERDSPEPAAVADVWSS